MTRIILLLSILSLNGIIFAQSDQSIQDEFYDAEYFLLKGFYSDALPLYQKVYSVMPENANIAYRIGLCYLNIEGKKDRSVEYLEKAVEKLSSKYNDGSYRQAEAPPEACQPDARGVRPCQDGRPGLPRERG